MAASHEYASELKRIREHLRLTQDELGQVLGVQGNSIMRYEMRYRKVPEPGHKAGQAMDQKGRYRKQVNVEPCHMSDTMWQDFYTLQSEILSVLRITE